MRSSLMRMYLIAAVALFATLPAEAALVQTQSPGPVKYSWAGKKMTGTVWGIARGDVDGDGSAETLLLEREKVRIGRIDADGFSQIASCDLPGSAKGARIYTFDIDDDSVEDIVVSAVEEGVPSSLAFAYRDGGCRSLFDRARMSLRVTIDSDGKRKLIGQGWSSDSYFFGPIQEVRLKKGRPESFGKLKLPFGTRLYQFTYIPGGEDARIAILKGYAPLEVRELSGKKFKKLWRSPDRLGGSPNQLAAPQRDVLGSEESDGAVFDTPPLAGAINGLAAIASVQSAMPVKNVIGKKPAISGSRVIAYAEDPALGFAKETETIELPSCISDFAYGAAEAGKAGSIIVVLQNECGLFSKATESQLISFEIPGFVPAGN